MCETLTSRRTRLSKPITTQSLTLVTILLSAIDPIKIHTIFDRDLYESRRAAMPGSRLLKVLAFFQLLKDPTQRGIVRAVAESQDAQRALGGSLARNTLSNALKQREVDQMIEARMMILHHYTPYLERMGKQFARIAAVDASLIKISLQAFDWATYRRQTGAAKITCVLDWMHGVPQQFVFTASGKAHDRRRPSRCTGVQAGLTCLIAGTSHLIWSPRPSSLQRRDAGLACAAARSLPE
jgi:hypothetical protein